MDERPAAWSFCHFGPHGPGYPIFYGTLGWIAGWRPCSMPVINVGLMFVVTATWLWSCPMKIGRLASAAILLATYWPTLLYLPTTMNEGLNVSLAFVLAAVSTGNWCWVTFRPLELAGCVWRNHGCVVLPLTWCVLFIPCDLLGLHRFPWRGKLLGVVLAAAAMAACSYVGEARLRTVSELRRPCLAAVEGVALEGWRHGPGTVGRGASMGSSSPGRRRTSWKR